MILEAKTAEGVDILSILDISIHFHPFNLGLTDEVVLERQAATSLILYLVPCSECCTPPLDTYGIILTRQNIGLFN